MAKKKSNKIKVMSPEQLMRKYPHSGLASVISVPTDKLLRLPTRSLAITHQLNGGPAYGKIVEIFGEESTGKSLIAMDLVYCAQALGGEGIWADAENGFNAHWFEKNGIDLEKLHLMTEQSGVELISDWIADTIVAVRSRLKNNEPIVVVVDSLAVLRCVAEIGESQMDSSAKFGNRAKGISDFLGNRNEAFARLGIIVVLINQLRRKIGASKFEDPDKTVGGDATKFYAAQRIGVSRGKQIKRTVNGVEKKVGQITYVRTKKDKTGPPRSSTQTEVYFIGSKLNPVGFSRYAGLPEILVETKVVTRKKGSSRYYIGDKMVANGEEAFLKKLVEDDDFRKKLIAISPINTISKTKAQLSNITTNLYPVE
jgi:recombination protein RecA